MSADFYLFGVLAQPIQNRVATVTGQYPTANRYGRLVRNDPFRMNVTLTGDDMDKIGSNRPGTGLVVRGRVVPRDDKPGNAMLLSADVQVLGPQPVAEIDGLLYGEWGHAGATLSAKVVSLPQVQDFGNGALRVSFLAAYNTKDSSVLVISEGACAPVHAGLQLGDRVNLTGRITEETEVDPVGRSITTCTFVVGRQDHQDAHSYQELSAAPRGRRERHTDRPSQDSRLRPERSQANREQRGAGNKQASAQQPPKSPRKEQKAPGKAKLSAAANHPVPDIAGQAKPHPAREPIADALRPPELPPFVPSPPVTPAESSPVPSERVVNGTEPSATVEQHNLSAERLSRVPQEA